MPPCTFTVCIPSSLSFQVKKNSSQVDSIPFYIFRSTNEAFFGHVPFEFNFFRQVHPPWPHSQTFSINVVPIHNSTGALPLRAKDTILHYICTALLAASAQILFSNPASHKMHLAFLGTVRLNFPANRFFSITRQILYYKIPFLPYWYESMFSG